MIRFISILVLLLSTNLSFSQITVFQDDMEGAATWTVSGDVIPNEWIKGLCAGSGPSTLVPGDAYALYITSDPGVVGCTGGLPTNYDYVNSTTGSATAIIYNTVPATCASNLQLQFDSKLEVDGTIHKGEVIYSINGGTSWIVLAQIPNNVVGWSVNNIVLPVSLGATNFLIGFQFTYDDVSALGNFPLAVDNVKIQGTDNTLPVVTCPPNQEVFLGLTCEGALGDYISLVTASDNCTALNDLVFAQSIAPGTIISTNTSVQITVTDEAGNEGFCSFTVLASDSIKPVVVCENELILPITATCEMIVPDVIALTTITDNCTTQASDFTFSQNPLPGSTVSGITQILITGTDLQGNSSTCSTQLTPNDSIPPTIVCPADKIVNTTGACDYTVLDYISESVITENCPIYTIVQNPIAGTSILTGENAVTMTITDQANLSQTCTFKITVIENQNPVITNCPANIGTCDTIVTFSTVSATDNCLFKIEKTDNSGLNSGDVFPIGITAMQYTATDSSGNTAVCNFNIEVYDFPLVPQFVTDSIALCVTNNTTIAALPITSGTAIWTVGAGSGTIANPNNPSTAVTNLSNGLNTFIWTISSANCGSKKDSVRVYVNQLPSVASILKDTIFACSANQSLLSGNLPTVGTSLWTTTGSANIVNPTINNTFANQLNQGWNQFYYTISSGNCPSSVDSISIYKNFVAQILSSDTSLCKESASLVVIGNQPVYTQTPTWYFQVGQGEIAGADDYTATITKISAGANQLIYRLSHPICGYSYDTLLISVANCTGDEFVFPTVITPNFDGKNDEFVIDNLDLFYPECQVTIVNRWGSVVYESTGYKDPWDGTYKGENLPLGTYFYQILLNDDENTKYSGPISIIR